MPRPPKLTPERQERVLAAIGAGATRKAAASYAGVDESTLYRWLKRNASFASLLRAREDEVEVRACAEIQQAASADWRAAAWWLERRRPADYGRTDRVDLNVRLHAERLAESLGLDVDELIAEAERIVAGV